METGGRGAAPRAGRPHDAGGAKPRVLVAGLAGNIGGTEVVVSRFVGALSDRFAFDAISPVPLLQPEFTAGDNTVIDIPAKRAHPLAREMALRRLFRESAGKYCALWHNANNLSNIDDLRLARAYGVPVRICHFHNARYLGDALNKLLSAMHKRRLGDLATLLFACSEGAGRFAYGDAPFTVVNNAFDVESYAFDEGDRARAREELGLENSFVVGNVGRLDEQKNQAVLLQAMPHILGKVADAKLVVVGEGVLHDELVAQARALGVEQHVVFTGARADARRIMSAFDVFAFPSLFEGLPIALLEAQANGLPCVVSDRIPAAAVVGEPVSTVPCGDVGAWAEAVCSLNRADFTLDGSRMGRYDIRVEAERLAAFFNGGS